MENYEGHFPGDKYDASGGPLQISKQVYEPISEISMKAAQEIGLEIKDPNGWKTQSFFPFDSTTKDGTRFSTQRAYLYPVIHRPNLKIQTYSHVTQVNFDDKNRATGVTYIHNGKEYVAKATTEVILSGGAFASPQLLMMSGIGPAEHLKSIGIPVRMDLPVGQGLQDHRWSMVGPFTVDDGKSLNFRNSDFWD